jgi:FKBP-type peptidyl-prolyl cis-trans isomerase FkpA
MSLPTPTPEFRRARFGAPFVLLAAASAACGSDDANVPSNPSTETFAPVTGVVLANMQPKGDGLYTQDLIVGAGLEAISGRVLNLLYTGWFVTGRVFDSNTTPPGISFILGRGSVIRGWDLGIVGMRPGGKRKLVIASPLAYGSEGRDAIPPNTTLVFDVTLLSVV